MNARLPILVIPAGIVKGPDNNKQLSNAWSPILVTLDGMAKGLIYEDDAQICDLNIRWAETIGGMLKVKIEEMK